ncbi:hypothetical protein GE09DRAFT_602711 [Coniochaeta sp. 2T2.1]|nr:hypothetical protein GE09DRAFT_602711 [Coniochaeta sp. 2T2.1]
MSGSERGSKRVARVEDADESDNPIEGTEKYAESVASPVKERPNTGRTRKEKARRDSSSPQASGLTDSDDTIHPRGGKLTRDRDSREILSPHKKELAISKQTLAMRPAAKHANTTPYPGYSRSDEAAYYGVSSVTPATSRPRARTAQRPASYYGNPSRPPPSNAQFYARQPPPPAPIPTSYPPPTWAQAGPMAYPMGPPAAPPPPRDYFTSAPEHLLARFGGRPASAMGHRPSPSAVVYQDYDVEEERHPIIRRPSKKTKDRISMPPPPRPQSARPTMGYRPPSTPRKVGGTRFEDDELDRDQNLFHVSPLTQYDYLPPPPAPRVRRPSFGAPTMSYDAGSYRTEVAGSSRRNSYMAHRNSVASSDYDDKLREQLRQANQYQESVAGGPSAPLTAEMLRRASKNGGSSRSTRSSESRDESDYRQSATTRTTRSSNEEDFTIKIKGVRSVEVGGARMHCDDGAEINIASRAPPSNYRGGSDRSSYIDPDDHRRIDDGRRTHRIDPPTRRRSGSQAGSFSRTPSRYDTAPPMPRYDGVRYDQFGYPLTYPPPPPGYI